MKPLMVQEVIQLESERHETQKRQMLIDRYLPVFDVTRIEHTVIEAEPEKTYAAVRRLDFMQVRLPGVRLLNWLRALPVRLIRWLYQSEPLASPRTLTLDDIVRTDWVLLGEEPGVEIVVGAVGKFWKPVIEWQRVTAAGFAAFNRPGYAKLAANFSVRPYGAKRSLLSYEARTATTDAASRASFRRYWRIIEPFAGYLMKSALATIKADAESGRNGLRECVREVTPTHARRG